MSSKPGVLLVTTSPLLPLNAGGRIYTWGTTEPLAEEFEYHLIALATPEEQKEFEDNKAELAAQYEEVFASFRLFPRPEIPGHMERGDALRHLWFHTRNGLPLMDVSYYSGEVVERAQGLVESGKIQVLEVDHAQMAYVRRFVGSVPSILVNHNIEGDLHPFWMTDRWTLPELVVWRAFAGISRRNTRRVEIRNRFGFVAKTFISPEDEARVQDNSEHFLVPVPYESGKERSVSNTGPILILWIGGFDWPPNLEAMEWFTGEVWPQITLDDVELHVVGANPPPGLFELAGKDQRVSVHGYVDDLTFLKEQADVFIAPLLTGSGVRVKVIEAMAAGIPVVATTTGAAGLTATPGRDFLCADDAAGFADVLTQAATSSEVRQQLSRSGQAYARGSHSPAAVSSIKAQALEVALSSVAQPAR